MRKNGLFIFRRDLRIEDNLALHTANQECENVYPIFIFTPEQMTNKNKFKSDNSIQFMIESLQDLENSINKNKGKLYVFYNDNIDIINLLVDKWKIDSVYFNKDISPYAKKRDHLIYKLCKDNKIACVTEDDYYLTHPDSIKTGSGSFYSKFTPYYKKVINEKITKPIILKKWNFVNCNEIIESITLNKALKQFCNSNKDKKVNGGRNLALKILNHIQNFDDYGETRNQLNQETTLLSAYLKYGNISVREAYHIMKNKLGIESDLIKQLIWKDFYAQLLYHNPKVLGNALKPKYNDIQWENNPTYLKKWKDGKTGFPIVDAGMRELNKTGYMHNRARLITASFLIKTLLIDWQKGEKYFAQKLTDYDPASNNGNWQWVASTGADSQPYFRIFNPWSQSKTHDSDCEYIKKWIPELEGIPNKSIHQWDKDCEKYITKYSSPIVDYIKQRDKALEMYKALF